MVSRTTANDNLFNTQKFLFQNTLQKIREYKNKKAMPKIMQNLVVLMEPSKFAYQIPVKGGNMCLNRFCIDEDDAFELSG